MQKVKSNASWNELSPEQLEKLDQWLFDEKLGYAEVFPKAQSELGFPGSISSLRRYGVRRQQQKLLTDFKEAATDAVELKELGVEPDAARQAGMMVMGAHFFRLVREAPDEAKKWAPLASLLLQNDHNEAWREIKGEEQKTRREALEFAKEKFQIDMVEQALEALPELLELAKARRAPEKNAYAENAQLNRARRKMFGVVWEVRPENAEEAAAMAKVKEAKKKPEVEQEKTEVTEVEAPVPGSANYEEYLQWKGAQVGKEHPTTNIEHPTSSE